MSIRRFASLTVVSPHARKNSVPPPKRPVPRLSSQTFSPEYPSCRYSIACCLPFYICYRKLASLCNSVTLQPPPIDFIDLKLSYDHRPAVSTMYRALVQPPLSP